MVANSKNKTKILTLVFTAACMLALVTLLFVCYNSSAKEGESGWYSQGNSLYFAKADGKKAKGYELIEGEPCYFNWQGKAEQKGWIKDKYYCIGNGKLTTGWKYIDDKAYYFYQDSDKTKNQIGSLAKAYTTKGGITVPKEGYLDGDEAKAIGYAIDVLDRYGWNLKDAYKYSSSLRCVVGPDVHYGYKIHKCALQGFENGEGNCLAWAGTFCVMAKVLGYDCRLIWGTLKFRGDDVVHGWTEIWETDGPHVYDPRKGGGNSLSGFNVHYGDKGTYKYNEDSKRYLKW